MFRFALAWIDHEARDQIGRLPYTCSYTPRQAHYTICMAGTVFGGSQPHARGFFLPFTLPSEDGNVWHAKAPSATEDAVMTTSIALNAMPLGASSPAAGPVSPPSPTSTPTPAASSTANSPNPARISLKAAIRRINDLTCRGTAVITTLVTLVASAFTIYAWHSSHADVVLANTIAIWSDEEHFREICSTEREEKYDEYFIQHIEDCIRNGAAKPFPQHGYSVVFPRRLHGAHTSRETLTSNIPLFMIMLLCLIGL